jgi:uncharacterized protein
MKFFRMLSALLLVAALIGAGYAHAQANLEINTPGVAAIQGSMQKRHGELAQLYTSGAVGLTRDGNVELREPAAVPLAQRAAVNALVAAENQDRAALYREIARANNHPEWEGDIRNTFAQRWIDRAQAGWYYRTAANAWARK